MKEPNLLLMGVEGDEVKQMSSACELTKQGKKKNR